MTTQRTAAAGKSRARSPSSLPAGRRLATIEELGEWIGRELLPELVPTRQERSLRTALALLEAGWRLLHDHPLDDLSIEMLCEEAGTTIGSFYGRFESKHAFFVTLQRVYIVRAEIRMHQVLATYEAAPSLEEACTELVRESVLRFREGIGVKRAALQHTREGMWQLFRAAGDRFRTALSKHLSVHLLHLPPKQRDLRIRFAHQMLMGTLVHAALNNPGPLALEDEAIITELTRMVHMYLASPR